MPGDGWSRRSIAGSYVESNYSAFWTGYYRVLLGRELAMPALQIARGLLLLAEIVLALPILYLCILSASALLYARKRADQKSALTRSEINFAILIPAHNEETIIGTLLQSLSELVY